jgi:hypothetical protein
LYPPPKMVQITFDRAETLRTQSRSCLHLQCGLKRSTEAETQRT